MNITLSRKGAFADVIKHLEMRRSYGIIQVALNPITSVLIRDTERRNQIQRKECNLKTEGVMQPQVPKRRQPPGPRRGEEQSTLGAPRGSTAQPHFGFLSSRTERINFCCFKPPSLWRFAMAALGGYDSHLDDSALETCAKNESQQ